MVGHWETIYKSPTQLLGRNNSCCFTFVNNKSSSRAQQVLVKFMKKPFSPAFAFWVLSGLKPRFQGSALGSTELWSQAFLWLVLGDRDTSQVLNKGQNQNFRGELISKIRTLLMMFRNFSRETTASVVSSMICCPTTGFLITWGWEQWLWSLYCPVSYCWLTRSEKILTVRVFEDSRTGRESSPVPLSSGPQLVHCD